jgi:hypothetical protein
VSLLFVYVMFYVAIRILTFNFFLFYEKMSTDNKDDVFYDAFNENVCFVDTMSGLDINDGKLLLSFWLIVNLQY